MREREREREFLNAKQAQRVNNTRTRRRRKDAPEKKSLSHHKTHARKAEIRQEKSFQKGTSSIFIFSKIIFSLLRYKSAHNRIPRTTLWRRRRSAQNTRVCHSPPIATTVDDFFDTSNAVVEVVVFRSPHQKSFNLAKRDVVARIIFAFKLRNVVSSPERFFFFTAP